ncbi:MAG: hypothetical protein H7Z15_15765 [Rhizobacter sp.]|nr:hypothetical protein [Rhizobacter sp.]
MSTLNAERLYALLPSVYRLRDAQQGHALRDLVGVIAQEFEALEEDIAQLYDDQFIETCADWAAPYIGDLIGYRPLHGVVPKVASPRTEVANTIGYRRRKGTAAMLEQLARDVTGWPARAVEFFEQLATTQYMNHTRLHAQATADLRSQPRMLSAHGAFNRLAHTAEMRRAETGAGRYNIPNVGLFLWRLLPLSVSQVPLTPEAGDASGAKFRVNPLGVDQPLFRKPLPEEQVTHIAEPANVPAPLRIRELALQMRAAQQTAQQLLQTDDYGAGRSLALFREGAVLPINRFVADDQPAMPEIRIADLRDVAGGWAHEAAIEADEIFIDPDRGRVLLGTTRAAQHADSPIIASYHRGFSREMAGGEYERTPIDATAVPTLVSGGADFQSALDAVASGGSVLVQDNLRYAFTPTFHVNGLTAEGEPGLEVVVAAGNGHRPLIAASGPITLGIGARGRLVLDGFVITGALQLAAFADDEPRELVLRHCTLLPGELGLRIEHPFARVVLEDCIVGSLQIDAEAELSASGCIIDAGSPEAVAIEGLADAAAGAELTLQACTVVGKLHTRLMRLASNTLFFARLAQPDDWAAPVWAERRQEGCVRFSFVPEGSLVPRRHRCLPDEQHPDVLPHFTSLRHADPGYAQLRSATALVLREGADDGGEIGAMHALHQPQREVNLRLRLDEYLRFGLHAGFFYVT